MSVFRFDNQMTVAQRTHSCFGNSRLHIFLRTSVALLNSLVRVIKCRGGRVRIGGMETLTDVIPHRAGSGVGGESDGGLPVTGIRPYCGRRITRWF